MLKRFFLKELPVQAEAQLTLRISLTVFLSNIIILLLTVFLITVEYSVVRKFQTYCIYLGHHFMLCHAGTHRLEMIEVIDLRSDSTFLATGCMSVFLSRLPVCHRSRERDGVCVSCGESTGSGP